MTEIKISAAVVHAEHDEIATAMRAALSALGDRNTVDPAALTREFVHALAREPGWVTARDGDLRG